MRYRQSSAPPALCLWDVAVLLGVNAAAAENRQPSAASRGLLAKTIQAQRQNSASRMMIGRGMPSSQSNAPLPSPMMSSSIRSLTGENAIPFHRFLERRQCPKLTRGTRGRVTHAVFGIVGKAAVSRRQVGQSVENLPADVPQGDRAYVLW